MAKRRCGKVCKRGKAKAATALSYARGIRRREGISWSDALRRAWASVKSNVGVKGSRTRHHYKKFKRKQRSRRHRRRERRVNRALAEGAAANAAAVAAPPPAF